MITRFTVILELLRRTQGKVGKTMLQKAVYILQDWLGLQLHYDYRLHYYGPYSSELADDLDILHDMGLIDMTYDPSGYGYQIGINAAGQTFLGEHLEGYMLENAKIGEVVSLVGKENARNAELIGTVLYFAKLTNSISEIRQLINTVKPHFDDVEIDEALTKLEESYLSQLSQ